MSVSVQDVKKIAALAHLEFNETETARYTEQLNKILEYMEKLNSLDTSQVDITYHPVEYPNVFREDEIGESLPVEEALRNAPQKSWQYFVVPKVVG